MEEALYEVPLCSRFAGIDLAADTVLDETTICKFRHLLERHQLADAFLAGINAELTARGLLLKKGIVVDATLIAPPPSNRNKEGKRDPEMSSTKRSNKWHFGMKAHIGADADSGAVHSLAFTKSSRCPPARTHPRLRGGQHKAVAISS
jgi:IS5 family transposase